MTVSTLLAACDHEDSAWKENITTRLRAFESTPNERNLRALLNVHSDGESMSFKLALVGKAFAGNPDLFREVGRNLETEPERVAFRLLAEWGDGVFEYFPEYEPEDFDNAFVNASWLEDHRTASPDET